MEIDDRALTAAHKAIEDALIDLRNNSTSVIGPANGFVIKDRDTGDLPAIMRLGTRDGLRIAIKAYLEARGGSES